jgi:hypothetical protein
MCLTRLTSFGKTVKTFINTNNCLLYQQQLHPTMPAILLTHFKGATISTLDPSSNSTPSTPLPIPSRFPSTSTPQTSVSPSGHVYLWCGEVNVVWEYDNKGKRVGEIVIKTGPIKRVLGAGRVDGKEMAVVESEQGLGLWSKASTGKWESVKHLDVSVSRDFDSKLC